MVADIRGHRGSGALKMESTGQLIGQQSEIEGLTMRQDLG
jgi:hypothetical protein